MARRSAAITFDVATSVGSRELRKFITESLQSYGGSRHPDDHLFHSLGNVKIKFLTPPKSNESK